MTSIKNKISNVKQVINDYFKYDELRIYLNKLNKIYKIKYHNINIYILYNENDNDINNDINHIKKVIKRAYNITQFINKIFNIYLILSPFKKEFKSISLTSKNCNTGLTILYPNSNVPSVDIYIIRREEFGKVIIHEIIHHINLIHSTFKKSNIDKLKKHFNISPSANIDPNETIVELWATIYHLYQISIETNVDFYKLFKDELKYSLNKTKQLLKLQEYMKDGLWYEESHIICYIIFKTIIMYNLCEFKKIYTFPYNDDVITDFIIKHSDLLSSLKKNNFKYYSDLRHSNSLCFMVHSDL